MRSIRCLRRLIVPRGILGAYPRAIRRIYRSCEGRGRCWRVVYNRIRANWKLGSRLEISFRIISFVIFLCSKNGKWEIINNVKFGVIK